MEQVVLERYREDQWPSRQKRLKAINERVSDLRERGYSCEVACGEDVEGREVFRFDVIRAIRFPEATYVRAK